MTQNKYEFTVEASSAAEENLLANDLQRMLMDSSEDIEVHRRKGDPTTLDVGAIVVALAGSQFLVELAKGVAAWVLKHPNASLTLDCGDGAKQVKISAAGLTPGEVAAILREVVTRC